MNFTSPAFWAAWVTALLAVIGVSEPGLQDNLKIVITGGAALVMAVYQWQHHRTLRNADNVAGSIARASAPPSPEPLPMHVINTLLADYLEQQLPGQLRHAVLWALGREDFQIHPTTGVPHSPTPVDGVLLSGSPATFTTPPASPTPQP